MQCPKCGAENAENARECARCGVIFSKIKKAAPQPEPETNTPPQLQTENTQAPPELDIDKTDRVSGFFTTLFDLSFGNFITPALVRAIYGIVLIFGGLVAGITMIVWIVKGSFTQILITLLVYLVLVVTVRIYAEFMIVAFQIEKNTRPTQFP